MQEAGTEDENVINQEQAMKFYIGNQIKPLVAQQ